MQPISHQSVEPYCFGPQTQDAETTQEERVIDFLNENKPKEALLLIAENPIDYFPLFLALPNTN